MLRARYQLLISEDVISPETSMKREISVNSPWRVILGGGGSVRDEKSRIEIPAPSKR